MFELHKMDGNNAIELAFYIKNGRSFLFLHSSLFNQLLTIVSIRLFGDYELFKPCFFSILCASIEYFEHVL